MLIIGKIQYLYMPPLLLSSIPTAYIGNIRKSVIIKYAFSKLMIYPVLKLSRPFLLPVQGIQVFNILFIMIKIPVLPVAVFVAV